LSTIIPVLFGLLIDEVIYYKNVNFFFRIALIYVVVYLIIVFIQISVTMIGRYLMAMLTFDIRIVLFKKIMTAKADYMTSMKSGDIMTILDVDMNACNNIITNILTIVNRAFQIALYLGFLLF
jgi:ATP-binding cassette subfamily B protein